MYLSLLKKRLFYGLIFALLAQVIGITKATAQGTTPFKTTWIATATHAGVYIPGKADREKPRTLLQQLDPLLEKPFDYESVVYFADGVHPTGDAQIL